MAYRALGTIWPSRVARTPRIHFSILVSRHQSNQFLTAQTQFIREMDDMT